MLISSERKKTMNCNHKREPLQAKMSINEKTIKETLRKGEGVTLACKWAKAEVQKLVLVTN